MAILHIQYSQSGSSFPAVAVVVAILAEFDIIATFYEMRVQGSGPVP